MESKHQLRVVPKDGTTVQSEFPAPAGPPVEFILPAPVGTILRWQVAEGIEILKATVRLSGLQEEVNLLHSSPLPVTDVDGDTVQVDFGAPRPLTKIMFASEGTETAKLMLQLGGTWYLPEPAGRVADFSKYESGTAFPELIAQKILLSGVPAVTQVESKSFPANVTLHLGDGSVPFFFHRGDLHGVEVPDFAEHLMAALRDSEAVGGICTIDLLARSEAFGKVAAAASRVVYRTTHGCLDGLSFEQRTHTLHPGLDATAKINLPSLTPPEGRPPVDAVHLGFTAFGLGPAFAAAGGRRGAVVSERFQVAQVVLFEHALTADALHLALLRRTPELSLTVELRQDAADEPLGAVVARTKAPTDELPEGNLQWLRVGFEEPVAVAAGTRLWIVLQTTEGEVEWRGDDVPRAGRGALFSTDHSNTWQPHPLTTGFLLEQDLAHLVTPPEITLSLGGKQQTVIYDPAALPISLDGATPLVNGLNAAITSVDETSKDSLSLTSNAPLPVQLTLTSNAPLPVQLTLTSFDVLSTQEKNVVANPGNAAMFSTLENEVVRILQANLPIPASSIVAGIFDPPPTERPWVTFTAAAFEMLPLDEASPPTGVKEAVEDSFPVDHEGPLVLSYRPLEPLRAVEVENNQHTRVRLRERDEYTVNYLEGQLHLRQKPVGSVRVQYFTHRPLEVITGTCVRIDGRLEIWADDPGPLTTAAVGALTANVGAFDGLVSEAENIPDSGLPSLGARRAFFLFEGLQAVGGEQTGAQAWRIDYAARATLVLTPADEEIGIMGTIVTSYQISKDQLREDNNSLV